MKLRRKRRTIFWLMLITCSALILVMTLSLLNPTNVAETRADHDDPRLRTRRYRRPLSEVRAAVAETIPTLKTYGRRWKEVQVHEGLTPVNLGGQHRAANEGIEKVKRIMRAEVPVLIFKDDLTVTLRTEKDETIVDVRSASRVGRSDLGENRRHIIQLLYAVDAKLNL
jgi:hypothetical protein